MLSCQLYLSLSLGVMGLSDHVYLYFIHIVNILSQILDCFNPDHKNAQKEMDSQLRFAI